MTSERTMASRWRSRQPRRPHTRGATTVQAASASPRKRPADKDEPGTINKHLRECSSAGGYSEDELISNHKKEDRHNDSHKLFTSGQNGVLSNSHPGKDDWKAFVKREYFNLQGTVFVPHVYMNCEVLTPERFAGVDVFIPQPPNLVQPRGTAEKTLQDSKVRNDQTHSHVLHCIQALADEQKMVVVSQLEFDEYLSNVCYWDAAETLPTPRDLPPNKRRGTFDILIIHPEFGLLIIKIKAVGDRFKPSLSDTKKEEEVLKKIELAIKQLNKEKEVLRHLVSDRKPGPGIETALVLPNVKKRQLQKILNENPSAKTDLCKCLGINESDDPTHHCLCEDVMSSRDKPWETADVKNVLTEWWRRVFAEKKPKSSMTEDDYIDIVARFCGPATFLPAFQVVKPFKFVKHPRMNTPAEAISAIGDRFSLRVLTSRQIEVLRKGEPRRFVCGPPGTGKTVVLMLMACRWLANGRHVHIVSTWSGSLAASRLIAFELKQLSPYYQERVRLHEFDLKEDGGVAQSVTALLHFVTDDELFVICDEASCSSMFKEICNQLNSKCKLHMWAASVYHGYCPPCLEEEAFCEPLRTPPVVTREVTRSDVIQNGLVRQYSTSSAPQPCDGPRPIWILHQGNEHTGGWTGDCEQCGLEVGDKLWELCNGLSPLNFRDIFVLTTYYDLVDELLDDDGTVEQPASGLVRGLRQAGVPVRVVGRGDSETLAEVVAMKGHNAVVAADTDTIRGLERKVAVWVQAHTGGKTSGEEDFGRLDAMSRTTAQLIVVA